MAETFWNGRDTYKSQLLIWFKVFPALWNLRFTDYNCFTVQKGYTHT